MLTPRDGLNALAAFLDQASPLAERWKRGMTVHTDEITEGLDELAGRLRQIQDTASREAWSRFDHLWSDLTNLVHAWRHEAMTDFDMGESLDGIVASGRRMLVQA